MTIKALYPTVRPTLNLDFAKTKALDPRVTFTRASTGTFVGVNGLIQTAASGAARFDHNPATGESLGLLVEEARTNLITYSEQFNNAAWIKQTNTTVTANTHVAPDGTTTADTINAIGNEIIGAAAVTASTTYTVSVFIRKTTGATIFPMIAINEFTSGPQRVLNTNTGQLVVCDAALNTGIQCESVGSYWRVSYSGNVGVNTTLGFLIYPAASTNGSNYTGGTGSIVAWGAQVEAGAFPTSYIPTVASTVTRSADSASITGTNFSSWYNTNTGTMYTSGRTLLPPVNADNPGPFSFTDSGPSSYANRIGLMFDRGAYSRVTLMLWDPSGGGAQDVAFTGIAEPLPGQKYSIAVAMQSANSSCASNGIVVANNTIFLANYVPSNITRLGIAESAYVVPGKYSGTIARLTYYPVRFPDAQLQALTAT
jgi:hypothetical protein